MLSAFGVEDTRLSKALTHDQKRDASVAGGAAGTVYGYQAGGALRARHNARVLADPKRAARVAEETAKHPGVSFAGRGDLQDNIKVQRGAYQNAAKVNPDVKRVHPTADRWSGHYHQVDRIRGAYDADKPVPGVGRAVLRPLKAKAEADANIMRNLNNAKVKGPTLHRTMRTYQDYKVGDTVDFHDLTSWSSDKRVADVYRRAGNPEKGDARQFHREGGHGTSFESASPRFQQKEWIAGGRHEVTHVDEHGNVHVRPTGEKGEWKPPPQKSAGKSAAKAAKNISRLIRKTDRVRVLRPL